MNCSTDVYENIGWEISNGTLDITAGDATKSGSTVTFRCSFSVGNCYNSNSPVNVYWELGESVVEQTKENRVEIHQINEDCYSTNQRCFTNLTLKPIASRDSGKTIKCVFVGAFNNTLVQSKNLTVYENPRVEIYTQTPSIKSGSEANITSPSVTITVYKGAITCSAATTKDETKWPTAVNGTTVTVRCPGDYKGFVSRKCNGKKWEDPDTTNCTSKEYIGIKKQIENIKHKKDKKPQDIDDVLLGMANVTNTLAGDVVNGVQTLEQIKTITQNVNFVNITAIKKTTAAFVSEVSHLLTTPDTVVQEQTGKKNTSSTLLNTVEEFGKSMAENLKPEKCINIKKENIEMEVKRVKKVSQVTFPGDDETKLELNENTLKNLKSDNVTGDNFTIIAVKYKSKSGILGSTDVKDSKTKVKLNSNILSLSIGKGHIAKLNPPLKLTFKHMQENLSNPVCVFWNFTENEGNGKWSSKGCEVFERKADSTVCHCHHLSNFALLMSPSPYQKPEPGLRIISIVGCSLSILGTVLTIIVHLKLWRYVKSDRSVILLNLCLAVAVAYLLFLVGVDRTENQIACTVIAAFLQYFFLSIFCLMLAQAIDLVTAVMRVFKKRSNLRWLLCLGWGTPALIVGISLGATQLEGYGDDDYCWLRNTTLYAFIAPVLVIILANFIILIVVMKAIFQTSLMLKKSTKEKIKSGIRSMFALLPVFGLTWVFGVLSINRDTIVFQYLFSVFNSLQGVFIFLFHCVLNRAVRQGVRNKLRRYESSKMSTTRTRDQYVTGSRPVSDIDESDGSEENEDHNSNSNEPWWKNQELKSSGSFSIPRVSGFRANMKNTDTFDSFRFPRGGSDNFSEGNPSFSFSKRNSGQDYKRDYFL